MPAKRFDRINAEMVRALQEIITTELKDPRISGMISIMSCHVTNDLSHANVSISIFSESKEKKQATFLAIEHCKGFIRNQLKNHIQLRILPELHFSMDQSLENSARINDLLHTLNQTKKE